MKGSVTLAEIRQQPDLWPSTLDRVAHRTFNAPPLVTGAGTSAFAAAAIAAAWPGAQAIPATDLLLDPDPPFDRHGLLISLSRSGNSSETVAVIAKVRRHYPRIHHLVITCNPHGHMAEMIGVDRIQLDPRTNDQSLVMTSSFSNLVLAGLGLTGSVHLVQACREISRRAQHILPELEAQAARIAKTAPRRVCVLASPPLQSLARETALKILEMTAGQIVPMPETFLGLRHGPMSFLDRDTLTVCFLSSGLHLVHYERDLMAELRAKKLGRIIAISPASLDPALYDETVPSLAPELPDSFRTPFDMLFPQLLAYYLSTSAGVDPDDPSPAGVITRVVEGVRIYEH
ncbi:MAG TPA: hypothetical protein VH325_07640 [Bryobacteraceae bacterium]|jgi:tagatose-6-phosphate ketose/aldose isomerase|nr:hypothetical protein [Bryobacteraceae bacterium]